MADAVDSGAQTEADESAKTGAGESYQDEADLVDLFDAEEGQDKPSRDDSSGGVTQDRKKADEKKAEEKSSAEQASDEVTDADLAAAEESEKETKAEGDKKQEKVSFTPEQQAVFDREINRKTYQIKTLEEELGEKTAKLVELEQKLESGAMNAEAAGIGLHPAYVKADEAKLIRRANELEREIEFCKLNLDGFEDPTDSCKSVSAGEIRQRLVRAEREQGVIQQANTLYQDAHKRMMGDLSLMVELRGQYGDDLDRMKADLSLAQAVRQRRKAAKAAADLAGKSEKPLPETAPGSAAVKPDAKTEGFNRARFSRSEGSEEDLVASGF